MTTRSAFVRRHLGALLALTCITAWFSYAYFHDDEYFQVIEFVRFKLGQVALPSLPWEHTAQIRPWIQPFVYWLLARLVGAFGIRDAFAVAFVFRLVTGLANVAAVTLFLRTTLPWMKTYDEKRLHVRVATLLGFLPYLFVRTSSESGSMAALTAGFALLLERAVPLGVEPSARRWTVPSLARPARLVASGFLFGVAFEMRYQTALVAFGLVAWLVAVGEQPTKSLVQGLGLLALGGALALGAGALVDRWGYGVWTFPAWAYVRMNILEGVAARYGTDPPFAYFWLLPANVFAPVVVAVLVLAVVAWLRCARHPITWATLPFFLVHCLLSHKEERFLFPIAILATAFVTMALGPSEGRALIAPHLIASSAAWGWERRTAWPARLLAVCSLAGMTLLAFVPLGWHHNVRFARYVNDEIGQELHATALPDVDPNSPGFHPRIYDVDNEPPEEIAARITAGTARPFLIANQPLLRTGVSGLDDRATLVYSELPFYRDRVLTEKMMRLVDAYNRRARPPLRPLHFRSLYRLDQ